MRHRARAAQEADGQCRVLVVEASDVAWQLLRHMLQSPAAGVSYVERARSGAEALAALAASTTALPDVVLLSATLGEEDEGRQARGGTATTRSGCGDAMRARPPPRGRRRCAPSGRC